MIIHSSTHGHRWRKPAVMLVMQMVLSPVFLGSCSQNNGMYPDILTEFADIHTSSSGRMHEMVLDDGKRYIISNTNIQAHCPDTVYRAVVGFLPESATASTPAEAYIYSLTGAMVLKDSTSIVRRDPTGVASMWLSGAYINMQFTALSQGGTHYWGYSVDAHKLAGTEGSRRSRHYLSVHHSQGTDPMSYSRTYYSSLLISSIPQYTQGDTISITVQTFQGPKTWDFCVQE